MTNDVKRLLVTRRLDVLTDLSGGRRIDPDTIDRLHGLYGGDFKKNLMRARDDLAEATLKATGPWEGMDEADVVRTSAIKLSALYEAYNYDLVDARQALREMGFAVPAEKAAMVFRRLVPPDPRADVGGFLLEDPRMAALREGLGVNRSDWALSMSFAVERAQRTLRNVKREDWIQWLD